jgi:outer membrane protein assembly factor BamB
MPRTHSTIPVILATVLSATLLAQKPQPATQVVQKPPSPDAVWPHWRGPAHNGVAVTAAPTVWSDTTNIAWKVEIPGRGHSTPVVWGDRLFLTTAVPTGRTPEPPAAEPPAPQGGDGRGGRGGFGRGGRGGPGRGGRGGPAVEEHRFEVMALDRLTGKVLWQRVALTAVPHEGYHPQYGSFASNAPTTDGQRVYASFGSRGIYVYDLDGSPVWQKDFGLKMRMFNGFGEGVGPVLDEGRLIVLADHEDEGFLAMLDAATGKEIWRVARSDGTNWAAPFVAAHNGRKQVVVNSMRKVRGYDYDTGRQIWEVAGLGQNTIPRPVQHQDLVLSMSGFRNPRLMAIRLGREGDLAGTDAVVWSMDRGLSYTASPALHDGKLYFITDSAMVTAVDVATGQPVYQQVRLPKPYNIKASPVVAGGHLYFATEEGDVVVARLGPSFEIVATNTLTDQSFVASPVVVQGDMYLRSRTHLFRIAVKPATKDAK